jgi:hypothetical protein
MRRFCPIGHARAHGPVARALNTMRIAGWLAMCAMAGCTSIVDVGDYEFCMPGTLRCECRADQLCDEALECRPPGRCVERSSAEDAGAREE